MKYSKDLLEQFDHLPEMEPSREWEERLRSRMRKPEGLLHNLPAGRALLIAALLFFAVHLFGVSKRIRQDRDDRQRLSVLAIEKEYLVFTESSKF